MAGPDAGPNLDTARMTLRALRPPDAADFVALHERSWSAFEPWMPARPEGQSFEQLFELELDRARRVRLAGTGVRLGGFLATGDLVGFFNLSDIVRGVFQSAHASWSVDVERTGRGLATEGAEALLAYAFDLPPRGLGLHRVQANVVPDNTASVRVAEKAGFRLEGLAKRYLKIAGVWRDHLMFARTVEERGSSQDLRGRAPEGPGPELG